MTILEAAGLKWHVDDGHGTGDVLGPSHEESVEREVLSRLPEGGVFLDVGAHVGHYTLRAAGIARKVIAVEPNPPSAARLRENLAVNGIVNVDVREVAAWDARVSLALEPPRGGCQRDGSTRVRELIGGPVRGIPLDDFLVAEPRVDLVKLDVEGADLHALRGMAGTLARLRPPVFIEDHSIYGYYQRADLDALAVELGYTLSEAGMYGCAPYLIAEPT